MKPFKMTPSKGKDLNIIEVDTKRVVQECYFMNAKDENNWRHQYILSILNDKNEVIPVYNPTNQGPDECNAHLKKVAKILNKSERVKLCVRDELEPYTDTSKKEDYVDFGELGKHTSPYYSLTFDTICNNKECFSISDTWTYTCPEFQK